MDYMCKMVNLEDAKPLIHDVVKELKAYMSVYKEVKKQLGVE